MSTKEQEADDEIIIGMTKRLKKAKNSHLKIKCLSFIIKYGH